MNLYLPIIIAQAEAPAAGGGSQFQFLGMMAILFAIMYFIMIRPQRRREKERKEMIANVKTGDRVMLTSGILGRIRNVNENSLIIQIAENTKIEVVKAAVSQVLAKDETPSEIEQGK
jgi:preprotein translocase subunit YajC